MYESMTYEYILEKMLSRVPDTMDKREGSIIYDAIAPAALELANMYIALDTIMNQTFADTASAEYLDRRVSERGIVRKSATCATVQGIYTPVDTELSGVRFNCGGYNYSVINSSNGTCALVCETAGTTPNGVTGILVPIDYVSGLETAEIVSILVPGEDEETDAELRERYYATLNSQAFGGNIADYIEKTNAIAGVGGVKVTPIWNGGGTVKLTIIASDFSVPTDTLVNKVQIDIEGTAPIGHVVTVEGVVATSISVETVISYQEGWNFEASKQYIEHAIDSYFSELAKAWDSTDNLIVRISAIETRLLGCAGVIDIADTTLNGLASNIQLDSNCIPVRGDVIG